MTCRIVAAVVLVFFLFGTASAATWDAASGFNTSTWSYGTKYASDQAFTALTQSGSSGSTSFWSNSGTFTPPAVGHDAGSNYLTMTPGTNPNIVVVRWTAPFEGIFSITGNFFDVNPLIGASVHVRINSPSPTDSGWGPISGDLDQSFSFLNRTLTAGTTVDFSVDSNGNRNQLIGLRADIETPTEPVPEPFTMLLFGTGLAGLFRAKRKPCK